MLSDTMFDVSQQLVDDLAHFKVSEYGYGDDLLMECLNLMAPLRAIGFNLDVGGDGTFEGDEALRLQTIDDMKMRLLEEFNEKVAELKAS